MYPAALHKITTQTVDSSQFLQVEISKSIRKPSKKQQKVGTETQSAIWNRFVTDRPKIFSLDCCRQRQFYRD